MAKMHLLHLIWRVGVMILEPFDLPLSILNPPMSIENLMSRRIAYLRRHYFYLLGAFILWNSLRVNALSMAPFSSIKLWHTPFCLWWGLSMIFHPFEDWGGLVHYPCFEQFCPKSVSLDQLECFDLIDVTGVIWDGTGSLYCIFSFLCMWELHLVLISFCMRDETELCILGRGLTSCICTLDATKMLPLILMNNKELLFFS